MYRVVIASSDGIKKKVADMYDWLCDAEYTDEANSVLEKNGNNENPNGDIFVGTNLQKTYKDFMKLMEKANGEGRLDDTGAKFLKSNSVYGSTSSRSITGKSWSEFIRNIESETKFKVDASCKRRPCEIIDLIDGPDLWEGEVTRYYDGTFELMLYNITGPYENDHQPW